MKLKIISSSRLPVLHSWIWWWKRLS